MPILVISPLNFLGGSFYSIELLAFTGMVD
jgi:hypothetical protein